MNVNINPTMTTAPRTMVSGESSLSHFAFAPSEVVMGAHGAAAAHGLQAHVRLEDTGSRMKRSLTRDKEELCRKPFEDESNLLLSSGSILPCRRMNLPGCASIETKVRTDRPPSHSQRRDVVSECRDDRKERAEVVSKQGDVDSFRRSDRKESTAVARVSVGVASVQGDVGYDCGDDGKK